MRFSFPESGDVKAMVEDRRERVGFKKTPACAMDFLYVSSIAREDKRNFLDCSHIFSLSLPLIPNSKPMRKLKIKNV